MAWLVFMQVLRIKEFTLGSIIGKINDFSLLFKTRSWWSSRSIQLLIRVNIVMMLSFSGGLFDLLF